MYTVVTHTIVPPHQCTQIVYPERHRTYGPIDYFLTLTKGPIHPEIPQYIRYIYSVLTNAANYSVLVGSTAYACQWRWQKHLTQ